MNQDDSFFLEIQDSFLQEALDLLQKVESLSLNLEKNPDNVETYEELARLAHNFKGSGKAVGFDHISKFAHKVEDYVLAIKAKKIQASIQNLDLLFKSLDRLKDSIEKLIQNKSANLDHDDLINLIVHSLQNPSDHQPISLEPAVEKQNETKSKEFADKKQKVEVAAKNSTNSVETVLRIQKNKIDHLLEAFGEQVILQSTLEQCKYDLEKNKDLISKTISQLTKLTFELQNHTLSLTLIQLGPLFTKLERAIRDASKDCGKKIEVILSGSETEVDKTLIDALSDALTHMVRNAVDHAIENAADRLLSGKPEDGKVTIAAKRNGDQLWIEVCDDGKGLDDESIKSKAIEKGLITADKASRLNKEESYKLIFANGFSTKEQVTELSGRGVGMNVVAEAVDALNGKIEIFSEIGKGTTFRLKLPISLAIFNGTVIRLQNSRFVVPNADISEVGQYNIAAKVELNDRHQAIKIRDDVYELIDLRKKFKLQISAAGLTEQNETLPILISKKHGNKAFVVDEILGMQKVVQKPLGTDVKSNPMFSAATILGDGTPGVILNLNEISMAA